MIFSGMLDQVKFSLEAAKQAQSNTSLGVYESSAGMLLKPLLVAMLIFGAPYPDPQEDSNEKFMSLTSVLKGSKISGRGCLFSPVYYVCQLLLI